MKKRGNKMKTDIYDRWWLEDGVNEDSMENQHYSFWSKLISYIIEENFDNKIVLDFGCNQGAFLRLLYIKKRFLKGIGIDLASNSIKIANSRKKDFPLEYFNTAYPNKLDIKFDVAFSSSVMFLIEDLEEHSRIIWESLKENGVYYATYIDYIKNPNLPKFYKTISKYGMLKMQLHSLNDIVEAFWKQGFIVEIQRMLPKSYITLSKTDTWKNERIEEKMDYEYEQTYIFRFVKNI